MNETNIKVDNIENSQTNAMNRKSFNIDINKSVNNIYKN